MTDFSSKWLVETDWLLERLNSPEIVILDVSATMPGDAGKAVEMYKAAHIPGAQFYDIDEIADETAPYPHMLASPEKFAARMRKLGVGDGMKVVVYDYRGIFFAPRAWWNLRLMGHEDVVVLNGGLPKWRMEGKPLEEGIASPRPERHFTVRHNPSLVRDLNEMMAALDAGQQVADARPKGRYIGKDQEPRPVPRLGHMPGARNVPFSTLIARNGTLKPAEEIKAAFAAGGIDPEKPVIASCGSGITACVLALGLAVLGKEATQVYDGSWAEWGTVPNTPVVQGE